MKACKQVEEDLHDLERESHWLAPPGLCLMESGLRLLVLAACCEPRGRTKEHAERINLDVFIIVAFYCCWWGGSSAELCAPSDFGPWTCLRLEGLATPECPRLKRVGPNVGAMKTSSSRNSP